MTTALAWTPPEDMLPAVATEWRAYYQEAWRNYGVTPRFYRALYLAQSGRCYICRTAKGIHPDDPKGGGVRRLGIDHNHLIGNRVEAVRGLLCTGGDRTCNRIIGWLGHDALVRAADYVAAPPAQTLRGMLAAYGEMTDKEITGVLT